MYSIVSAYIVYSTTQAYAGLTITISSCSTNILVLSWYNCCFSVLKCPPNFHQNVLPASQTCPVHRYMSSKLIIPFICV